jgi:hypothetical protein
MYYMVKLNGVPLKRWLDKDEAEATAERWQGSHGGYHGGSGLLKIKDRRDHVEVCEDKAANKEFDERYKVAKAGDRQRLVYEQRVESLSDADPGMRG